MASTLKDIASIPPATETDGETEFTRPPLQPRDRPGPLTLEWIGKGGEFDAADCNSRGHLTETRRRFTEQLPVPARFWRGPPRREGNKMSSNPRPARLQAKHLDQTQADELSVAGIADPSKESSPSSPMFSYLSLLKTTMRRARQSSASLGLPSCWIRLAAILEARGLRTICDSHSKRPGSLTRENP